MNKISYLIGLYPVFSLLESAPQRIKIIYYSSKLTTRLKDQLLEMAKLLNVEVLESDRNINKIASGSHAVCVYFCEQPGVLSNTNHIILDQPSDMGNIGTIIRSMVAFCFYDLVIIGKSADVYDKKVIRASMGALLQIRISFFQNIKAYLKEFNRVLYPFMLDGAITLDQIQQTTSHYALVFGNEGTGLDSIYNYFGLPIKIDYGGNVDSLNLGCAASIALYHFYKLEKHKLVKNQK